MKLLKIIRHSGIILAVGLLVICMSQRSEAQRFSHGGGSRGGGGGMRGGGFRGTGNRDFQGGGVVRPGRSFIGIRRNESVFHHVYGFHPYAYHPYHPYIWGPYWHPFGFFINTLTANAIMLSIANQQYYYDNGVYYAPSGSGYTVVPPPVGAVVNYLPGGYITVPVGDMDYYYYGGAFYVSQGGTFRVVPAPPGAIVNEIPEGATEQVINGENYLLYNNTYYQPISQNGQDAYEVVQIN